MLEEQAADLEHAVRCLQEWQAATPGDGERVGGRSLVADPQAGAQVGDLGGLHRVRVRQPGDEQGPMLRVCEHVAHQVGGETSVDLPVKPVFSGEDFAIQQVNYLSQPQCHTPRRRDYLSPTW